jgi:hypothetical protein
MLSAGFSPQLSYNLMGITASAAGSSCRIAAAKSPPKALPTCWAIYSPAIRFPSSLFVYLSAWYTKRELGKRIAGLYIAQQVGNAFGGLFAAAKQLRQLREWLEQRGVDHMS